MRAIHVWIVALATMLACLSSDEASATVTVYFHPDQVATGVAIKVPLAELIDSKENVRSALNRATRKGGRIVATASDGTFLYVWNETP